jgi:hypothetical protein
MNKPGKAGTVDIIAAFGSSVVRNPVSDGINQAASGNLFTPEYRAKLDNAYNSLSGAVVTAIVGCVVSLVMMIAGTLAMLPIMRQGPAMVGQILGAMINTGGAPSMPRVGGVKVPQIQGERSSPTPSAAPSLPSNPSSTLATRGSSSVAPRGGSAGGSPVTVQTVTTVRQALPNRTIDVPSSHPRALPRGKE